MINLTNEKIQLINVYGTFNYSVWTDEKIRKKRKKDIKTFLR